MHTEEPLHIVSGIICYRYDHLQYAHWMEEPELESEGGEYQPNEEIVCAIEFLELCCFGIDRALDEEGNALNEQVLT